MLKRKRASGDAPKKSGSNKRPKSGPVAPQPEKAVRSFEAGHAAVLRALKKARGFERQRLQKRIAEETGQKQMPGGKGKAKQRDNATTADTDDLQSDRLRRLARVERLQRETQVLRTLDLDVAARVHLAHVLLRHRPLAEAPGPLGPHIQKASETLAKSASPEEGTTRDDIHNVTSALYNRPFVRAAVAEATAAVCGFLGVPVPDAARSGKKARKRGGKDTNTAEGAKEEEAGRKKDRTENDDISISGDEDDTPSEGDEDDSIRNHQANKAGSKKGDMSKIRVYADSGDVEKEEGEADVDVMEYDDVDDEEIERDLAKYDALVAGSSDDDDDSGEEDSGDERASNKKAAAMLRERYLSALAQGPSASDEDSSGDGSGIEEEDYEEDSDEEEFRGFDSRSDEEESDEQQEEEEEEDEDEEEDDEEESSDDESLRPRKRAATSAPATSAAPPGSSHFLPTLMGGYISDGGSDGGNSDDEDHEAAAAKLLGAARKNRRGQRARQAIWEKKYKQQARHLREEEAKQKQTRTKGGKQAATAAGWDAKRGAVDAGDGPRWLRRKQGRLLAKGGPSGGGGGGLQPSRRPPAAGEGVPPPRAGKNPGPKQDNTGPLHPSWEAARKAKEKAETATFQGKKIVFD